MGFFVGPQEQSGLDLLLGSVAQGAGEGIGSSLEKFYQQKEQEKKAAQFEKAGLPAEFANLDPQIVKTLIPALQKEKLLSTLLKPKKSYQRDSSLNGFELDKLDDANRNLSEDEILATTLVDPNLGRAMQSQQKLRQQENLINKKETAPIRAEYAKKGEEADKSLRNKEQMLALIEKGDINHPIVSGVANILPFNIGQMLLSDDSQLYRSLLFENFSILKSMFPGQVRVKEIELLEDKLAGLEKNDEAKKAIIENQINLAKADQIRSQAASEVEEKYPYIGMGAFNRKVEEIAKPKLDNLYKEYISGLNNIVDKYQTVLNKLPPASEAKGQMYLDENSGKKYRSNGKTWKMVK